MQLLPLLSLLALCQARPAITPAVTVTVRAQSDVANRTFTVGEIAEITGADKPLIAQVAAVEVGASPLPGLSRPLFPADILTHLRMNKVDLQRVRVVYPAGITIRRSGSEVPPAEIVQAASDRLMALFKTEDGVSVEAGKLSAAWVVPPGSREYLPGEPRVQADGSAAVVPVTVQVEGKIVKSVEIPFRIKRTVSALVAKRLLPALTALTADDVIVAKVEITARPDGLLVDPQTVVGKRVKRQLALGAPLTEAVVENAPVVTSGAAVTLEMVIGGLRISAPAIARMPGAVGDLIRVVATDTRKELSAVVVDAKTVRLEESK